MISPGEICFVRRFVVIETQMIGCCSEEFYVISGTAEDSEHLFAIAKRNFR